MTSAGLAGLAAWSIILEDMARGMTSGMTWRAAAEMIASVISISAPHRRAAQIHQTTKRDREFAAAHLSLTAQAAY